MKRKRSNTLAAAFAATLVLTLFAAFSIFSGPSFADEHFSPDPIKKVDILFFWGEG